MSILAIVGSRYYDNYEEFVKIVKKWKTEFGDISEIVSGGASGVDSLAARYAKENNIKLTEYLPDWTTYGKTACTMRNTQIINHAQRLLALPGPKSRGTYDSINKALKKKMNIVNIQVDK